MNIFTRGYTSTLNKGNSELQGAIEELATSEEAAALHAVATGLVVSLATKAAINIVTKHSIGLTATIGLAVVGLAVHAYSTNNLTS